MMCNSRPASSVRLPPRVNRLRFACGPPTVLRSQHRCRSLPAVNEEALLVDLDDDQKRAVTCAPTATIVHAGAGSGKTRVLTHRIAWRIAHGD
ncbi:MAG: hypothetical protein FJW93_04385, partial [Actinobacteria bacterium]|nr:hypothetical protein [Actinomycetota bacterium]